MWCFCFSCLIFIARQHIVIFYAELTWQTDELHFRKRFGYALQSDTAIRCACSQQYERDCVGLQFPKCQASVKRQRETVDINEWRTANGHCCLSVVSGGGMIHEVLEVGEMDSMTDDCFSSCWREVLRSPPPPPPYPCWTPGVEQLNHLGLLTHSLSTAQYTISLCSGPDQCGYFTVYCPLW